MDDNRLPPRRQPNDVYGDKIMDSRDRPAAYSKEEKVDLVHIQELLFDLFDPTITV